MLPPVVDIRPATEADARALVLRKADREEVEALTGRDPQDVLVESVHTSAKAWSGLADGRLVCMFGVAPQSLIGAVGIPWLLGSPEVCTFSRQFLRRNKAYVREMLRDFPILRNVVDQRNAVSIRWLGWLGFRFGIPQPMGPQNLPFIPFQMEAH